MRTFALLLLVLPALTAAEVNWPINSNLYFAAVNITVESTGQELRLNLGDIGWRSSFNLWVKASVFNVSSSPTFDQTAEIVDSENRTGIRGTDDFTFGNENATFLNLPVDVFDVGFPDSFTNGEVGWNVPTDGSSSFVQSVLKQLEEEIVVFSFDPYPFLNRAPGLITLGGRPADRCGSEWTYAPTIPITRPEDQWAIAVDEFSFGSSTIEAAGNLHFSFTTSYTVHLPAKYEAPLTRAWGVPTVAGGYLPCNTTLELVFRAGDAEIRLPPTDYVGQSRSPDTVYCGLRIAFYGDEDEIELPAKTLQRYCLLLDYAHLQLGFAPRLH
ncbi:hypothetical protein M3Y99_01324100 [Aphelenchoides fujianensis]|nr:hypothetical protein M3Y99_01324100 [Aphelenchoides fujianensis]